MSKKKSISTIYSSFLGIVLTLLPSFLISFGVPVSADEGSTTASDNDKPTNSNYLPTGQVLCPKEGGCRVIPNPQSFTGPEGIPGIVGTVGGVLVFVISSIAVLFMIWGAWDYMRDPDKGPELGRKKLINAAIAIAIAVLSFTITQIIVNVLSSWNVTPIE